MRSDMNLDPRHRDLPSRPPLSRLRGALAAGAMVALAGGCGIAEHTGRDSRPHPGVARAYGYPVHGIDIARYQGEIDWQAVRAAGVRFAYVKATEGGDYVDPKFQDNWRAAKAAGVPVGAYHFVFWCRPAHEQAAWFRQHIPNDPTALPPVLDLEWNGHSRTCPQKIPREQALEKIRLMLAELEQLTGKRPVIYTDITFHREVLQGESEFDKYAFWLRSTAANPEERYAGRRWSLWQYTTTAQIPGIRVATDKNAFGGTEAEFKGWVSGQYDLAGRSWNSGRAAPQPAPVVVAAPLPAPAAGGPSAPVPVAAGRPQPVEEAGE